MWKKFPFVFVQKITPGAHKFSTYTRNKLIISIIPGAKGQHIKISSIQKVDFESLEGAHACLKQTRAPTEFHLGDAVYYKVRAFEWVSAPRIDDHWPRPWATQIQINQKPKRQPRPWKLLKLTHACTHVAFVDLISGGIFHLWRASAGKPGAQFTASEQMEKGHSDGKCVNIIILPLIWWFWCRGPCMGNYPCYNSLDKQLPKTKFSIFSIHETWFFRTPVFCTERINLFRISWAVLF